MRLVLGRKAPQTAPAPVLPVADYIFSAGGCICALGFKVCRRQSCCIFSIRHPCLDSHGNPTNIPKCSNGPIVHWECASTSSFFWKMSKIMDDMEPLNKKSKQSKQLLFVRNFGRGFSWFFPRAQGRAAHLSGLCIAFLRRTNSVSP